MILSAIGLVAGIHEIRRTRALIPSLLPKAELMLAETLREVEDMIPSIDDFVSEEGGEWRIDERLVKVFDVVGSRMATSLKMSFLQGLGAQAKIDKGIKGAMALDVVENKMPILNLVGDFLGFNTKQYISKHPEALAQLAPLLAKFMPGIGQPQNNPGGGM